MSAKRIHGAPVKYEVEWKAKALLLAVAGPHFIFSCPEVLSGQTYIAIAGGMRPGTKVYRPRTARRCHRQRSMRQRTCSGWRMVKR